MSGHQASVPPRIAAYFDIPTKPYFEDHPTIHSTFTPGEGWRRFAPGYRKRVSFNAFRQLRKEGVTVVAVEWHGRVADFQMSDALAPTVRKRTLT
jgi:hypothetical protein